jgi:hypothetical protein
MFNCEFEQPAVKQVNGKNIIIPIEQYGVKLILNWIPHAARQCCGVARTDG